MLDSECVALLQWALPGLRMRWKGFRKVRRQVCKRVTRRLRALNLADVKSYQAFLLEHPQEWRRLDAMCRISISRFYRDKDVFRCLGSQVLPELARRLRERHGQTLRVWSAGCASGEEPYGVVFLWENSIETKQSGAALHVIATDADPVLIERARAACYSASSLKEIPPEWFSSGFSRRDNLYCVRARYRQPVQFKLEDIRTSSPGDGRFDLILCRNLVFTYFDNELQAQILERLRHRLVAGGALVIGKHEKLPGLSHGFEDWFGRLGIFRHVNEGNSGGQ